MQQTAAQRFGRWLIVAGVLAAGLLPAGCEPPRRYSQATPEAAMQSAVDMVRSGDAKKLPDLVYADSPRMRALLDRLGVLLGHMGELAAAVEKHCPGEVETLKAAAEQKVQNGSVVSLFAGFGGSGMSVGGGGGRGGMGEILARIYADPYGWLERGADRVSFVTLTDDTAVIHFDDQPSLSALGIAMKKEDGKWYLQLPTNLASRYMPRTEDQWLILESIVAVFDATARDLTKKVRSGEIRSLAALGEAAEERLLIPAAISFGAYAKEMDVRDRAERAMRRYRTARKGWEEWRAGAGREPVVSGTLRRIMDKIALVQLEHAVRMEKRIDFDSMAPEKFQALIADWLAFHGVPVQLDSTLDGDGLDASLEAWETANPVLKAPEIRRQRSDEPLRFLRRPD